MPFNSLNSPEQDSYGITISGHFYETDSYLTLRPNGMNEWLIIYTLSGEGYFISPTQKMTCHQGDVILLKPGRPHQYGTSKGQIWHFVWAHFSDNVIEKNLLTEDDIYICHIESKSARKRIFGAFRRIIADSREIGDYWRELSLNALREILLVLAQRNSQKLDARVKETLHFLSTHMRESLQIEDLAQHIGLSPSRLSHLFKSTTGQSIVEVLNQMRIRQAALLLEHTNRNAIEVAQDVGFNNYNHFIKQFRKNYGTNPSTFKKEKRKP